MLGGLEWLRRADWCAMLQSSTVWIQNCYRRHLEYWSNEERLKYLVRRIHKVSSSSKPNGQFQEGY